MIISVNGYLLGHTVLQCYNGLLPFCSWVIAVPGYLLHRVPSYIRSSTWLSAVLCSLLHKEQYLAICCTELLVTEGAELGYLLNRSTS